MSVAVMLSSNDKKDFSIGDIIKLQFIIDEQVGNNGDEWQISSNSGWLNSGNLTLRANHLKSSIGNGFTKIEVSAVAHSPGSGQLDALSLIHNPSKKEFSFSAGKIEALQIAPTKGEVQQPKWIWNPVHFGSWNYFLIFVLFILLALGIFFSLKKLLSRVPLRLRKRLNPKEKALRALTSLQSYGKPGRNLKQEDWKKFSFQLAGILRHFSDAVFSIDTSDLTDKEFLSALSSCNAKLVMDLKIILSTIDEVRYGKKDLDSAIVPSLLVNAKKYVEENFVDKAQGDKK